MKRWRNWYITILLVLAGVTVYAESPAVLLVGAKHTDWGPVRRLQAETDFVVGAASHNALTWELLQQYNLVVLFDMRRLDAEAPESTWAHLTPADHQRITELLARYVNAGGGLYVYAVSFMHMGQGMAAKSLNQMLERFDAQAPFELLHDPPREQRQPGGRQVLYALADRLVEHPVTEDVEHYWYPIGRFVYGPYVRALSLGDAWTPLIFTSPDYTSQPLGNWSGGAQPLEDAESVIESERAPLLAVCDYGDGRVLLNAGESTISFFGYRYSDFADREWQRIGMERGLDDKPSDGWQLFVNALRWLAEPSVKSGKLGGYRPPPVEPREPRVAQPRTWELTHSVHHQDWLPGLVTVIDPPQIEAFVAAAKERGLSYLVAAGRFETMNDQDWRRLEAQCAALSDESFVAVPAVMTRDEQDNSFIQAGPKAWPRDERLSNTMPKRVRDHLGYWMNDAGFPMRVIFNFSAGKYPPWLFSAYNSFGVRTWQDGELIDEAVEGFQQNQEQGDRSRLVAVHILSSPDKLREARELTWQRAKSPEALRDQLAAPQYDNNLGCVSSGPRIRTWRMLAAHRQTYGDDYVPGTERWRAQLVVESEVPLTRVTIYDSTDLFRRFAVDGERVELPIDGLHGDRHVLTAIIEDAEGNQAMTGPVANSDSRFRQTFCSDRCNIMGGLSMMRDADGFAKRVPASAMLYKAGRLQLSTVGEGEELPGIDGSGQGTQFFMMADLRLVAADKALSEARSQLHHIFRPWESADGLVFHTPIARRSEERESNIFGHRPYVALEEPRHDASLTQYHFYRSPISSPALGRFQVTAKQAVTTAAGWQGLHVRFSTNWGKYERWTVVRRNGDTITSPEGDKRNWRGRLETGDSLYLPDLGEGFFVRSGPLDIVIDCIPSHNRFRLWTGLAEEQTLAAGESVSVETVILRVARRHQEGLEDWRRFGQLFGLYGEPGYDCEPSQGMVTDTRYICTAEAQDRGFAATFRGDLPQRLPLEVQGIQPHWTAGIVDNQRRTWQPIGAWNGAARTTLALSGEPRSVYIGNLLTAEVPELRLTLLPANSDGTVRAAVHNPTSQSVTTIVRVPVTTWLAPRQEHEIEISPFSTISINLQSTNKEQVP